MQHRLVGAGVGGLCAGVHMLLQGMQCWCGVGARLMGPTQAEVLPHLLPRRRIMRQNHKAVCPPIQVADLQAGRGSKGLIRARCSSSPPGPLLVLRHPTWHQQQGRIYPHPSQTVSAGELPGPDEVNGQRRTCPPGA